MRTHKPKPYSKREQARILAEFCKKLEETNCEQTLNYTYTPKTEIKILKEKIILNFETLAWLKMNTLVQNSSKECAWHGIVEASEDRKSFTVKDILVYPQKVTSATVEADDKDNAYEKWHQGLDNYAYNHLRMQAHSHVNMGVTPSTVDKNMYKDLINHISADGYYIFLIGNKSGDIWVNIYDLAKNVIYEREDIRMTVENFGAKDWFTNQQNYISDYVVKEYTRTGKHGSAYKSIFDHDNGPDEGYTYRGRERGKPWTY